MNATLVLTILIWTLIVAALGFAIGRHFGDQRTRRRYANQELRDKISRLDHNAFMLDHQLKKVLDILNDIRSRIPAVTKGLEKPAP
jgi:hypothetical protein